MGKEKTVITFGKHVLDDFYPDIQGNIPFKFIRDDLRGVNAIIMKLKADMYYSPHSNPVRMTLEFLEGTGLFMLDARTHSYQKGSLFIIGASMVHQFQRTYTDTYFVKKWRDPIFRSTTDR